ncbi:unnamed protein product [Cuscuta europaea]|uniref:Uncharacterized protein n=1 Tax=Cuscuta europaea TaxID=41803 RepID=A0A9P1EIY5_CUSEU|nr:unnamed protein product [Cuscuta europaea]
MTHSLLPGTSVARKASFLAAQLAETRTPFGINHALSVRAWFMGTEYTGVWDDRSERARPCDGAPQPDQLAQSHAWRKGSPALGRQSSPQTSVNARDKIDSHMPAIALDLLSMNLKPPSHLRFRNQYAERFAFLTFRTSNMQLLLQIVGQ